MTNTWKDDELYTLSGATIKEIIKANLKYENKTGYKKALLQIKAEIHKSKEFQIHDKTLNFPYDDGIVRVKALDKIINGKLEQLKD